MKLLDGEPNTQRQKTSEIIEFFFKKAGQNDLFAKWCLGRESNPHARKEQGILSPLCLPVPPPRRRAACKKDEHRPSRCEPFNLARRRLRVPNLVSLPQLVFAVKAVKAFQSK